MTMRICVRLLLLAITCFFTSQASAVAPQQIAPSFERVPLQGGAPVSLESFKGQVVYLDFWASWCGPCRKSMPFLESLRKAHHADGFEVLAINMDAYVDEALRFLRAYPVSYPVLRDTGSLPELYGVEVMPTSYLIDRNGIVRMVHYGFRNGDKTGIRKAVTQLLEEGR